MSRQEQIDKVNELVEAHLVQGVTTASTDLIEEFRFFLMKQAGNWCTYYEGVHSYDHAFQEAMIIFHELLEEFTIGGDAYFTVYIQRKLPLRLRYFFVKEIKRRSRELSYSDDQFRNENLLGIGEDIAKDIIEDIGDKEQVLEIYHIMHKREILTERETDMVIRSIVYEKSHQSIADSYDISRSRVSKIIQTSIQKIQYEIGAD